MQHSTPTARSNRRMVSPAPSPMTNPSRSLSQGLLAVAGSSLRLLNALQAMNPPMPDGITAASAEPLTAQ
jgi:hypothetical protein